MPQLAPMPWITLFALLYLSLALILVSLWAQQPPLFMSDTNSTSPKSTKPVAWNWA